MLAWKQMLFLESRPHMSMKLDRAGMRMWEGLREREARSNPGGYEKILKNTRFFALVVLEYLMEFVRKRTNFATEQE